MIRFKGLVAPTEVPTGDGRMFASGKATHRPMPLPVMAQFGSGGHTGATPVAKIEAMYPGPGGYWVEGCWLDPAMVPEVPKAIYMVQEKVMGPSVDLDRDYTLKTVQHPSRPDKKAALFEEYNIIGMTLVPMPAFSQVYLSVETPEEKALLASAGVNVDALLSNFEFDELTGDNDAIFAAHVASLALDDEAECGCNAPSPDAEVQGIYPQSQGGEPVTSSTFSTSGTTVTVNGVVRPSTVTVTFNQYPGGYGDMMPMDVPMGGPVTMEKPEPVAVVKVFEDATVVKLPEEGIKVKILNEDKMEVPGCYFDDEGHCPVHGY